METRRWTNPSQPQTLQIAVFLLYINAVLGLLLGNILFAYGILIGLASIVAFGAGGFGIANERKWGYSLSVAVAVLSLVALIGLVGLFDVLRSGAVITLMFDIALLALLLHPQSRDYQRIWFN